MAEISLEQVVKMIGIGKYLDLRGSSYTVKFSNANEVSLFFAGLAQAGFTYGGRTINPSMYDEGGQYFLEFDSATLPRTEPVSVEWTLAPDVVGKPMEAMPMYIVSGVIEGLANAAGRRFCEDTQKEYRGVRGKSSASIIATLGGTTLTLKYQHGDGYGNGELTVLAKTADGTTRHSIQVNEKNARDETEALVGQIFSESSS